MANNEQRKIEIIANGTSVNATFTEMAAAAKLLENQLKKLPPESQEFADKSKQFQDVKKRMSDVRKEMHGTTTAMGGASKATGLLRQGFDLAVKAFLPMFAFSKIVELVKGIFELESQWTKLKGTIEQTSGLQGEALDQAAIQSQAIANTFDKTNTEIFNKAKVLVNSFGITYNKAFKIIEDGLIAANENGDEFLEQIGEYSVQFADAGASAEDFAAQTVKALNEGIFSDKGADVIKEFGLRVREQTKSTNEALETAFGKEFTDKIFNGINDGSLTTVDALKLVSQEMNNTKVPANQLQTVVADVFGGPGEDAGMEYLLSLKDIGGEMSDLIDVNSEYVQKQQTRLELEKELARAQEALTEQFEGTSGMFSNLITQGQTLFYDVLAQGISFGKQNIVGLINYFIELYNNSALFRTMIEGLQLVFNTTFEIARMNVRSLADGFVGIGQIIKAAFTGNFEDIPRIFQETIANIGTNYEEMGNNIASDFRKGVNDVVAAEKIPLIDLDEDQPVQQAQRSTQAIIQQQQKATEDLKKSREEYDKLTHEADLALQKLRIEVMQDGVEKELAALDFKHRQELEKLNEKEQKIRKNILLNEQEKAAIYAQLEEEKKLIEEQKAIEEEEIRLADREERIEKELEEIADEDAIKAELLDTLVGDALDKEAQVQQISLDRQIAALQQELQLLRDQGSEKSKLAQDLTKELNDLEKEKADMAIAEEKRKQEFQKNLIQQGYENAKSNLANALTLLDEESKARKAAGTVMKATLIGETLINTYASATKAYNALAGIPIAGPALGAVAAAMAVASGLANVKQIAATKYARGGSTGSGNVIDMSLDGNSWRQPGGQGANWIGSFAKGGHIGSASFGLIGERGSEWVAPNWMLRSPKYANIIGYLEGERVKGRAFESGGSTAPAHIPSGQSSNNMDLKRMEKQNQEMISVLYSIDKKISEWPTRLKVVNDPTEVADALNTMQEIDADSRITRD